MTPAPQLDPFQAAVLNLAEVLERTEENRRQAAGLLDPVPQLGQDLHDSAGQLRQSAAELRRVRWRLGGEWRLLARQVGRDRRRLQSLRFSIFQLRLLNRLRRELSWRTQWARLQAAWRSLVR